MAVHIGHQFTRVHTVNDRLGRGGPLLDLSWAPGRERVPAQCRAKARGHGPVASEVASGVRKRLIAGVPVGPMRNVMHRQVTLVA